MWPIGHLFVFMGQTLTYVLKQIECTNCTFTSISGFQCLAHLSWKLKWASDYLLSVHMSVLNFSHFHLLDQFQPNLAQSILGWRRFKFVQMKGHALFQGEILMKYQKYIQYASSQFRRNYVPLLVLFRKWGMKGVCLRKRWGKC